MRRMLARIAFFLTAIAAPLAGAHAEADSIRYAAVPPGAYSVVAEIDAKPGKADELRAVTLPLIAQVRGDPKNLAYFLQEDRARPGHFVFYEIFATKADFDAHNAMPYVLAWFETIKPLAEGGVRVMHLEILAGR